MKAVVQRVKDASVEIDAIVHGHIDYGLLVFLGIEAADDRQDCDWLIKKIVNMRILNDTSGVMNESILEQSAGLLVISQFTLHASTKKGNRPSYTRAAPPEVAIPLYDYFISEASKIVSAKLQTGVFGAHMHVSFTNDGPVTIILDSKNVQ